MNLKAVNLVSTFTKVLFGRWLGIYDNSPFIINFRFYRFPGLGANAMGCPLHCPFSPFAPLAVAIT